MSEQAHNDQITSVSIALSGGGHRAALFAAGALMALVDADVHPRVRVIASVSGGSITNGLVAAQGDFSTTDAPTLEEWLQPGIETFAEFGLFFPGPATDRFVQVFFLLVGAMLSAMVALASLAVTIGQDLTWTTCWLVAATETVVVELVAIVVSWWKRDKFHGRFLWPLLLGLLLTLAAAPAVAIAPHRGQHWWVSVLSVLIVVLVTGGVGRLTVWWFGRRSEVVDVALHSHLLGERLLAQADHPATEASGGVHHVFCATNLSSGTQVYLSPRLVSGYDLGTGKPSPELRLSTAVQASAAFPGGFSARRLVGGQLFDGRVAESSAMPADLVDGGVYDNMGDQWELGWADRRKRVLAADPHTDLKDMRTDQCDALVVINAGGHYGVGALRGRGLRRELGALMKDKSVMYDQTTAIKRRYLYDAFVQGKPMRGAIAQIGQSPYDVPKAMAGKPKPDDMEARADAAKSFLDALAAADPKYASEDAWAQVRDANRDEPTVLSPVGRETAARLMWHGYVVTRVNMYVLLDLGGVPADLGLLQRSRFRLAAGLEDEKAETAPPSDVPSPPPTAT